MCFWDLFCLFRGTGYFLLFGLLPLFIVVHSHMSVYRLFLMISIGSCLLLSSVFILNFLSLFGNSNENNLFFPPDVFEALSELIILTASHCLHGKEIRSQLNEKVAQLYADLDGGFSHAAWLLPGWLPLPSFRYG